MTQVLKSYRDVMGWLFRDMSAPVYWWKAILWWELRRVPYNLIIGIYSFLSLIVFYLALNFSGHLQPGEDAVEPLAILIAPFIINILYTLGWFTELLARMANPTFFAYSVTIRPLMFKLGLAFSFFVVSIPSGYWIVFCILQLCGIES
jgi:hypothetical protein